MKGNEINTARNCKEGKRKENPKYEHEQVRYTTKLINQPTNQPVVDRVVARRKIKICKNLEPLSYHCKSG
jgi:hypothetical protein